MTGQTSSEQSKSTIDPAHPDQGSPTGSRRPRRRMLVIGLVAVVTLAAGYGYYCGYPFGLPALPDFERIRQDDTPVRKLAEALEVPAPPDLTDMDEQGARHFYDGFASLRWMPRRAQNYGTLGMVFEAAEAQKEALAFYERAVQFAPRDYRWHHMSGRLRLRFGQHELATKDFERAIALQDDDAPAYLYLAKLFRMSGESAESESAARRYIEFRPDDPLGYAELAQAIMANQKYEEALKHMKEAMSCGDLGRAGHQILGTLYQRLGDAARSREHLQLAQSAPPPPAVYDALAAQMGQYQSGEHRLQAEFEHYFGRGDFEKAAELAQRLTEEKKGTPDEGNAWGALAECYRNLGRDSEALEALDRAIDLDPDSAELHSIRGLIHLKHQRYDQVLSAADEALRIEPDLHYGRFLRGTAIMNLAIRAHRRTRQSEPFPTIVEQVRRAEEDLRDAVRHVPNQFDYQLSLGICLGLLGEFEDAAKTLRAAARVAPNDPRPSSWARRADAGESFWDAPGL